MPVAPFCQRRTAANFIQRFKTTIRPCALADATPLIAGKVSTAALRSQRVDATQTLESREVTVGGAKGQSMLDSQSREVRIRD